MSNADTLRQGDEAFGRGDLDAAVEPFAGHLRGENPEAPQVRKSAVAG